MFYDFTSFVLFAIVTNITPGPNNISALSFCLHQGYKKTLSYILGIICGVCTIHIIMASLVYFFQTTAIAPIMEWVKYIGATYILYLAYKTFRMNVNWESDNTIKSNFIDGYLLQAVNPKLYLFSLTLLTTFINYEAVHYYQLLLLASGVSALTFLSVSSWGAVGAILKQWLQNPLFIRIFGAIMSLGLVYTAYRILV